jgi:hypothetical protein
MSDNVVDKRTPYMIPDYKDDDPVLVPNVLKVDFGHNSLEADGQITNHLPTEESMRSVQLLAMAGCSEKKIADIFGLPLSLFRKHYDKHVKIGSTIPVMNVMQTLYVEAIKQGGDVQSASAFLKVATKGPVWKESEKDSQNTGIVCEIKFSDS